MQVFELPIETDVVTCAVCHVTTEIDNAIESGWAPCVWTGNVQTHEATCHQCLQKYCEFDENDGEWVFKGGAK